MIIFAYLPSFVSAAFPDENGIKRVLVVNSYHLGYSWTDDVMNGVRDVLDKQNGLEVFIEYLDTKRYVEKSYFQFIKQLVRYKYKENIDVIIISDDNALDLVLETKEECFPDAPIVFCGVDRDREFMNSAYAVTGSSDGIKSTIDLILSLHPNIETVFFVSDESTTGKSKLKIVRQFQPAYKEKVEFEYLSGMSMDELQAALRKLPEKLAVFNLVFIIDSSGKVFHIKESLEMIGNSARVPVYCSWGFQPDIGVMGGHINTGFVHGERTAQIAVKLLDKEERAKVPHTQKVHRTYMFDYTVMKRFNIGMNDIPENSILYNKPFSIYEKYRWHIIGVIIFMVAQAFLVVTLLINQKKRKRAEDELQRSCDYLKNLTDSMGDAVFSVKMPERKIEWANYASFNILGYDSEELIGRTTEFLYPNRNEFLAFGDKVTGAIAEGKDIVQIAQFLRRKSGEAIPVEITVTIHKKKGEEVSVTGIIRDITERKQAEQTLQAYQQRLKALVSQLTIAEEKERSRIAVDMHDHVGQSLALARMQIAAACKSASDAVLRTKLADISKTLLQGPFRTRDISFLS